MTSAERSRNVFQPASRIACSRCSRRGPRDRLDGVDDVRVAVELEGREVGEDRAEAQLVVPGAARLDRRGAATLSRWRKSAITASATWSSCALVIARRGICTGSRWSRPTSP